MHRFVHAAVVVALATTPALVARADGLAGSPSSMVHQHEIAVKEDYSFLHTPKQVQALATKGALVPVTDNADLALSGVSYPFARPEVRDFVQRFAAQYHQVTGARLVVTSLTRPTSAQPANAHKLSVHPAGMAVDLRVPATSAERSFLESSLLAMEKAGVLDVTREHVPAHYHVAVFADAYARFAARQDSIDAVTTALRARADSAARTASVAAPATAAPSDGESPAGALVILGLLGAVAAPAFVRARRHPAA